MNKPKPCPKCNSKIEIGYACGEYFIMSDNEDCSVCGVRAFTEMHSNEEMEIEAWNKLVDFDHVGREEDADMHLPD